MSASSPTPSPPLVPTTLALCVDVLRVCGELKAGGGIAVRRVVEVARLLGNACRDVRRGLQFGGEGAGSLVTVCGEKPGDDLVATSAGLFPTMKEVEVGSGGERGVGEWVVGHWLVGGVLGAVRIAAFALEKAKSDVREGEREEDDSDGSVVKELVWEEGALLVGVRERVVWSGLGSVCLDIAALLTFDERLGTELRKYTSAKRWTALGRAIDATVAKIVSCPLPSAAISRSLTRCVTFSHTQTLIPSPRLSTLCAYGGLFAALRRLRFILTAKPWLHTAVVEKGLDETKSSSVEVGLVLAIQAAVLLSNILPSSSSTTSSSSSSSSSSPPPISPPLISAIKDACALALVAVLPLTQELWGDDEKGAGRRLWRYGIAELVGVVEGVVDGKWGVEGVGKALRAFATATEIEHILQPQLTSVLIATTNPAEHRSRVAKALKTILSEVMTSPGDA